MQKQKYKTIISSKKRLFDLHIKETFSYRDLTFLFVKRDFTAKYKQTILGLLWAIIQPLLTTVVFTIVFGSLAKLTTADTAEEIVVPAFLFYMAGNICWAYFSSTLSATSNTFIANRHVMGKVYYPRLVTPIATALSDLISFEIQFAMFVIIWIVFIIIGGTSIAVTPKLLFVPLVILQLMILSTAFLLGAEVIEKHFTLDKTLIGNDHYHAGDPDDFKKAIANFEWIKTVLGSGEKTVLECEKTPRREARRSLVLTRDMKAGKIIRQVDLMPKRPGTGISPIYTDIVIGRRVLCDLKEDTILTWDII